MPNPKSSCFVLDSPESVPVIKLSFIGNMQRTNAPELEPVTQLRRIAGFKLHKCLERNTTGSVGPGFSLPHSSDPDENECQTLFLISNCRGDLQHPGAKHMKRKKNVDAVARSHPSLPHPRRTCTDYDTMRVWNPRRSSDALRLHHPTLVLVTFQQQKGMVDNR